MPDPGDATLTGWCVLVVEDEYLLADDLKRDLEGLGAEVMGPVASVPVALELLGAGRFPDAAVLDVNLGGEAVFPVADMLRARGVPFVLVTGYDAWALPPPYADAPRCEKPLEMSRLVEALRR